jgi:putative membrane protein
MIQTLFTFLALNTISVYLVHQLLDGFVITGGVWGYVLVGTIIGILNLFVKPILKVLSLPFIFLTVGLFLIVINGAILWLAEQLVAFLEFDGIQFIIDGLGTYVVSVLILGFMNYLFQRLLR